MAGLDACTIAQSEVIFQVSADDMMHRGYTLLIYADAGMCDCQCNGIEGLFAVDLCRYVERIHRLTPSRGLWLCGCVGVSALTNSRSADTAAAQTHHPHCEKDSQATPNILA